MSAGRKPEADGEILNSKLLETKAVVFEGDKKAKLRRLELESRDSADLVIDVEWSGVSTGTERLLWSGKMPPFPGMGYPLVPGYEAVGRVLHAEEDTALIGARVFVPGASCYKNAHGLFGASASRIVTSAERVVAVDFDNPKEAVLLALAATAYHAIAGGAPPDLIVGHGVLGRLLVRITMALGETPPNVWEINPERADGDGYVVVEPEYDGRSDYSSIYDVSGDAGVLDSLIAHMRPGGEITLAGFYTDRPSFAFPPAFMKEARLRVAAEWTRTDLDAVLKLIMSGALSLDGLITHTHDASRAEEAYGAAFEDPSCLKMVLDWRNV
ncbi:MAG: chlorophyll synthesis pathway protein BchC [Pseudomonadota bacterium]